MALEQNITDELIFPDPSLEWDMEKGVIPYRFADYLKEKSAFSWFCALAYLVAIFATENYMKTKQRYDLRRPMMCWSLLLAIFSIMGAIRMSLALYEFQRYVGFRGIVCSKRPYDAPISRFWGGLFTLSKIVEYVDTAFIVLRKNKLIFLHWYHHVTVATFTWWCYSEMSPGGFFFTSLNYMVHAVMYTYYTLKAAGVKIPRIIALVVTTLQILQMIFGCIVVGCIFIWRAEGGCDMLDGVLYYAAFMYGSYFVLFANFFYKTYLRKKPGSLKSKDATEDKKISVSPATNVLPQGVTENGELRERKRNL